VDELIDDAQVGSLATYKPRPIPAYRLVEDLGSLADIETEDITAFLARRRGR
jgi:hypothetical protein